MLLEELALFQSRLEGRPISTEEAMRLTMEQLVDSLFPVRMPTGLKPNVLVVLATKVARLRALLAGGAAALHVETLAGALLQTHQTL